ncbi:HpcH/HpaI aldolase/citrate lyase family protein [Cyclonatronum proteinivorum]|uniref:HpcH/HpaI aldolase/citrate lyase family protein n=1 Tax=Cyclonatronum proteinivorum TaxID=1457365 RepID=A0A345UMN0_9BACT|nr:aldolase/citrate lyase family protein [Cyclonatronum proteinivorum]AXJ01732.1 HpcH/HpaI aldolase/citrate lyase family protein [Cyclonatronum proteinivorum]
MIFKYITNKPELANFAVGCGVNRIFVDMEYVGKDRRQGHLNAHRATHTIEDIQLMREAIPDTELMVRVNPVYPGTQNEVNGAIEAGADVIMLPMFTTAEEVGYVADLIDGRARFCPLLETPQALVRLDEILEHHARIDEMHVGLNDLHLGLGLTFMFEVLTGGLVELAADKIKAKGIRFGFGGIARIGQGAVAAELVLGEHVRLGSEMVILSRTFHKNSSQVRELVQRVNMKEEIDKLKNCINSFKEAPYETLLENKARLTHAVRQQVAEFQREKQY